MPLKKTQLVAFPYNADLDILAAVRCMQIVDPDLQILHPVRLRQNAWEYARKQKWFKTVKLCEIDFAKVSEVHLPCITLLKHNPELIGQIVRHNICARTYSIRPARLPVKVSETRLHTCSVTAEFLQQFKIDLNDCSKEDLFLFCAAITEKTHAGLSSKVTPLDLSYMARLRKNKISARRLSNLIITGLREGQTGLYHHILKSIEDIHPGNWPVSLIRVNTSGQVQDLEPVVDAVWSDISPLIMVICVTSGTFSRVWARSDISQIDFADIFKNFHPKVCRNWVCFNFSENNSEINTKNLADYLLKNLPPDQTAESIMSVAPQCIDLDSTIEEALDLMLKFNIMSLVVLKDQKFAGLINRRDLDRAIKMDLMQAPIGPYVPTNTPTVGPNTPVRAVKSIMVRFNLTRIPVIADSKVVGIITARELLRALPDYIPLPPDFLPLARQVELPTPLETEEKLKRVFSLKLLHILTRIGKEASRHNLKVYAVGGFVRDLLLDRSNLDIDIVVTGDAIPFARSLSQTFKCDFKLFERFHTARIYLDDLKIDFSSARIEHYSDPGALPQIEFSGLSNDLFRRDFSINALALNLNPENFLELKDFFGGFADLLQKKIRILHSFSFIEDPTRLFRAVRFARRFSFQLEKDTKRAFDLAIHRGCAQKLSKKRIGTEISRCLNEPKPHEIVEDLFNSGLMQSLSPRLNDTSMIPGRFKLVRGLVKRFKGLDEEIDEEAILWTGLLSALPADEAGEILDSIGAPHTRRVKAVNSIKALEKVPELISEIGIDDNIRLYQVLSEYVIEALISLMAFALEKQNSRKVLHFLVNLRTIKPEITGADLIAAKIPSGPLYRKIFKKILELKLSGQQLTREKELNIASKLYQNL